MRRVAIVVAASACSAAPAPVKPPVVVVPAPPVEVELEVTGGGGRGAGEHATSGGERVRLELDQPPHVKLKLGHYWSEERGVGLVIDRLTDRQAWVKFDFDATIYRAYEQQGRHDRYDYIREPGHLLLHVWDSGRVEVYVPGPDNGPALGSFEVIRDGDAHPVPRT